MGSKHIVDVVGTGTSGEPLIGLLCISKRTRHRRSNFPKALSEGPSKVLAPMDAKLAVGCAARRISIP